jgi:hypothetical protein
METNTKENRRTLMFSLIREQQAGAESQQEYCQRQGIKLPTFHYWKRKYRESESSSSNFLRVSLPEGMSLGEGMTEITYPNGVRLRISGLSLSGIKTLIQIP